MKHKLILGFLALAVLMLALTGCYELSEEMGAVSDASADSDQESADSGMDDLTGRFVDETAEKDAEGESALLKILNKEMENAEEDTADDEDVVEEIVVEEAEEEAEEEEAEEDEVVETTQEDNSGIPQKVVKEGDLVDFSNLKATDSDGDALSYTYSSPIDSSGKWQTEEGDAGEYLVTITASDGKSEVSQKVMIVVESLNRKPVVAVKDITVEEGETVKIVPQVIDEDGDSVTLEYSGWMDSDTYTTTSDDAGVYTVKLKVSDGKLTVFKDITITVTNKNSAPVLADVPDVEVVEGEKVIMDYKANDPDGDLITFRFTDPVDDDGEWQTEEGDAGEYLVTVTASDGELKDTQGVLITVVKANAAPTIYIEDVLVQLGDTVTLVPEVDDADGDDVTVAYSGWMTTNTKLAEESGEYEVVVTASDGIQEVSVTIVVEVNTPPTFDW
ncbi:MAG: hypothetical protein KAI26_01120 [Nanoarchaeota archaeon]|nr:hypothetical protein [Nanoarchaeota archaeon]